ncbi:MAG TPA: ferrochelatase [Micropepsaceae bacterium]|nr:ferrochelatase [Micropepsaceae bacterium]
MKLAVVLFNLGGPDSLEAVEPFLENLFNDPAVISLPGLVRRPLARLIARRRGPVARKIYEELGGRSPIVPETAAQRDALRAELASRGLTAECFIAMRCWSPLTQQAVHDVKASGADRVVLLPLYPQYSTTTSRSSLAEWRRETARQGLTIPVQEVCCYPFEEGLVAALAALLEAGFEQAKPGIEYRVLFSAHGLPKRTVTRGDPYQWQVEQTVGAVVNRLKPKQFDWQICYQSRVGPLQWIGPATDSEVRRAGSEGKGLIILPVAFVSEHSETLVELDIEYLKLAKASGARDYIRLPTVRTHPAFIRGLADLVQAAVNSPTPVTCAPERICPKGRICEQPEQP